MTPLLPANSPPKKSGIQLKGCLGSLALIALVLGVISYHFRYLTAPYEQGVRVAMNSYQVQEELGSPIRFEPVKTQIARNVDGEIGEVTIPLVGPNGRATCHFKISKIEPPSPNGKAEVKSIATDITVTFQRNGQTIRLQDESPGAH